MNVIVREFNNDFIEMWEKGEYDTINEMMYLISIV